jgi:ankyrin repeat protein
MGNKTLDGEWANACLNKKENEVEDLIRRGYMRHKIKGIPVLFYCLEHPELVSIFIRNRYDINQTVGEGQSLMHQSASQNYIKTMKLLLENGADFSAKDSRGKTPFDVAKEFNRVDSMRLLLGLSRRKFPDDIRYFDIKYVCKDDLEDYEQCKLSGASASVQERYRRKLQVCQDLFEE